jgi:hypothetical protein
MYIRINYDLVVRSYMPLHNQITIDFKVSQRDQIL